MNHIVRVKFCGITSLEDANKAISLGVDAVGFLVGLQYPSEDQLEPEAAKAIVTKLPPFVGSVLVTHKTNLEAVVSLCKVVNPVTVQLHGDFPFESLKDLRAHLPGTKIIKAVHVEDRKSIDLALKASAYHKEGLLDSVLLDTKTSTRIGGTGLTHDWSLSHSIRSELATRNVPVILAGGLTPQNVGSAIQKVDPFGVDVNTGVTQQRGVKSQTLMKDFLKHAKSSQNTTTRIRSFAEQG